MLMAASTVKQFKSLILPSAIALTCSAVTVPTRLRFGSALPVWIFAASLSWPKHHS